MRDDNARLSRPQRPDRSTPMEVIVELLSEVEAGDTIWVHQTSCDTRLDDGECDCVVTMVPIDGHIH